MPDQAQTECAISPPPAWCCNLRGKSTWQQARVTSFLLGQRRPRRTQGRLKVVQEEPTGKAVPFDLFLLFLHRFHRYDLVQMIYPIIPSLTQRHMYVINIK